jgi:hypothetical protein
MSTLPGPQRTGRRHRANKKVIRAYPKRDHERREMTRKKGHESLHETFRVLSCISWLFSLNKLKRPIIFGIGAYSVNFSFTAVYEASKGHSILSRQPAQLSCQNLVLQESNVHVCFSSVFLLISLRRSQAECENSIPLIKGGQGGCRRARSARIGGFIKKLLGRKILSLSEQRSEQRMSLRLSSR